MSRTRDGARGAPRIPVPRPPGETFPDVLDKALGERRLSLRAICDRVRSRGASISPSTLSYWRSGQRQPEGAASLEVVALLEDVLGLPDGDLLGRIGPARRTGPTRERALLGQLMQGSSPPGPFAGADPDHLPHPGTGSAPGVGASESAPDAAMTHPALDRPLDHDDDLRPLSIHVTVEHDDQGRVALLRHRSLMRASVDGADRIPLMLRLEDPSAQPVEFRVVGGGRLTAEVAAPTREVRATYLVLDSPLSIGETVVVEYEMTLPELRRFTYYEEYLLRRTPEVLIWVRFHPDALPIRCERFSRGLGGPTTEVVTPVDITGLTSVHHVARGQGPGAVGVRWTW